MQRQNDKWFVGLDDGSEMMVTSDNLLDRNKFEVAKITTTLSGKDKEKYSKQKKREANRLDGDREKEASRVAHERRNEMKKRLFRDLNEQIRTGKALDYGEFLNMSELLEKPFKTTVGSFEFAVGGASSEACLKTMTGKLISECVAGKKRMKEEDGSEWRTKIARPNQRRVNTWHGGDDAVTGEATLSARDVVDAEKTKEEVCKRLSKAIGAIERTLTQFTALTENEKAKCEKDPAYPAYWVLSDDRTWDYLKTYVHMFHLPGEDGKPISASLGKGLLSTKNKKVLIDIFGPIDLNESRVMEQIAAATIKVAALKERLRALAGPDVNEIDESTGRDGSNV
eukprot:scaffold10471_cov39-Attheya_sp.AAC.1